MNVDELNTIWKLYNVDALKRDDFYLDVIIIDMSNLYVHKFPLELPDYCLAKVMEVVINDCVNNFLSVEQTKEDILDMLEKTYHMVFNLDLNLEKEIDNFIRVMETSINRLISRYIPLHEITQLANGDTGDLINVEKAKWLSSINSVLDKDRVLLNCLFTVYTKKR